jgi:hypothetical protein
MARNSARARLAGEAPWRSIGDLIFWGPALLDIGPIETMIPPSDIPETRRVLGLFVVSRKHVEHYAMITKPITDILRGRKPVFSCSADCQAAFGTVRAKLLDGIHLSLPRYDLPFHLKTDASDDGKGGGCCINFLECRWTSSTLTTPTSTAPMSWPSFTSSPSAGPSPFVAVLPFIWKSTHY